jgi:hypothetical protein
MEEKRMSLLGLLERVLTRKTAVDREMIPHVISEEEADLLIAHGSLTSDETTEKKCPYGKYESCYYRHRVIEFDGETYHIAHVSPSNEIPMYSVWTRRNIRIHP